MIDRIVDASAPEPEAPEELQLENSLRPQDFANYIGQELVLWQK
jgi:Holliday junction resolvasome RuvABC ATP-dependent DNA helicase subunit